MIIETDEQHAKALAEAESLIGIVSLSEIESVRLEELVDAVHRYEEVRWPIPGPLPEAAKAFRREQNVLRKERASMNDEVAKLTRERDAWIETARLHCQNESYYRGLLDKIAEHIGRAAYLCDDGSTSESPLRARSYRSW
jgi:hypothetical protein